MTDIRLTRRIGAHIIYLDVTNLFNTAYEDIPEIPMPGKWIMAGIELMVDKAK